MRHWLLFFWSCLLTGLGLLSWAAYDTFGPAEWGEPALDPGATEIEVSGCVVGEKRDIVFRLHNRSTHPVRVLGRTEC